MYHVFMDIQYVHVHSCKISSQWFVFMYVEVQTTEMGFWIVLRYTTETTVMS